MKHEGKYSVSISEKGKMLHLGYFATPEEGALCYARHIGAERAAAEAAKARGEGQRPLTPDEARAAAAAEGLELVPSSSNKSGFKGVYKFRGKYQVSISESGKMRFLGNYATPEEGALCYAKNIGAERAAAEAAKARGKHSGRRGKHSVELEDEEPSTPNLKGQATKSGREVKRPKR